MRVHRAVTLCQERPVPIASSDIQARLSGGAANTSPAASLGGAESTAGGGVIATGVANNLWPDVTGAQSAAGDTRYRGFYWHNAHATLTLQSAIAWFDTAGGSPTVAVGTDARIALATEAVGVAMATIANDTTIPTGVTWGQPTSKATGQSIGSIPAASYKGVWLERTVSAGAAAASDSMSVRVEGDTAP